MDPRRGEHCCGGKVENRLIKFGGLAVSLSCVVRRQVIRNIGHLFL